MSKEKSHSSSKEKSSKDKDKHSSKDKDKHSSKDKDKHSSKDKDKRSSKDKHGSSSRPSSRPSSRNSTSSRNSDVARRSSTKPATSSASNGASNGAPRSITPQTATKPTTATTVPPSTSPGLVPKASGANSVNASAARPSPALGAKKVPGAAPPAGAPPGQSSMYGSYGGSMYGAQPGSFFNGAGSMMGNQMGSLYAGQPGGSMYGQQQAPGGSLYGTQGAGGDSMYGAQGAGGSMYGPMGGSMYGPMGSMYGPMGSMYGPMGGSMYGPMGGSMYGMGGPMGSMYGPMGSMYGPMGSMYGMGGPMGSMYGMGGPMGSMYGMGGMGSLYGLGSSFLSYGGGSMYGGGSTNGSLFDIGSASFRSVGGVWAPPSSYQVRRRSERLPTNVLMLEEAFKKEEEKKKAEEKKAEEEKKGAEAQRGIKPDEKAKGDKATTADERPQDAKGALAAGEKPSDANAAAAGDKPAVQGRSLPITGAKSAEAAGVVDDNVHAIIVLDGAKIASSEGVKVADKTVTVHASTSHEVTFKPSEIIATGPQDLAKSAILADTVEHVSQGHNVCVVFMHPKDESAASKEALSKMICDYFKSAMERLSNDKAVGKWKFTATAATMPSPQKRIDLSAEGGAEEGVILGSNPLFGPCIMNCVQTPITTVEQGDAYFGKVAKRLPGAPANLSVLHAIVQHERGADLFLSSIIVAVARSADLVEAIAISDDRRISAQLLKTAIGGACRTAAVLSLSGEKAAAEEEVQATKAIMALTAVKNTPPRSGNTSRFIDFTRTQATKLEAATGDMKDPETKERQQRLVERLRTMITDTEELQKKPDETVPKAYIMSGKSHRPAAAESGSVAAPAAAAGSIAAAAAAATAASIAASRAASGGAAKKPDSATPQAAARAAAAQPGTAAPAAAAEPVDATPFSSVHRWAVEQNAPAANVSRTIEITAAGSKKAYDVDECVHCVAGAAVPACPKEVARMQAILATGRNTALLGAECVPGVAPAQQATWVYAKSILAGVLDETKSGARNEFRIFMSVVHQREVLGDLLAADPAKKRPLVVASSPLFGPMVHHATAVKVVRSADVAPAIDGALAKAAPLMTAADDAMIVMTAVLKQRPASGDDVSVASLFAVSAADTRPYSGVVERDAKYSRSLFSYALGGPSSTAVLVTVQAGVDGEKAAAALTAQRALSHIKTPVPRNGSVKGFVEYARSSKGRMAEKAAAASDAEKARMESGVKRLEESLADHEKLLKDPEHNEPMAYAQEGAEAAVASRSAPAPAAEPKAATPQPPAKAPTPQAQPAAPAKPEEVPAQAARKMEEAPVAARSRAAEKAGTPAAKATPKTASPAAAVTPAAAAAEAPAMSPGDVTPGKDGEGAIPVRYLAVVTKEMRADLKAKEGWSVTRAEGAENKLVVTDVDGPHEFSADEVIIRDTRRSAIRSHVLDELRDKFLQGQNVALLTADARGSTISLEVVDRTARSILGKVNPESDVFMSLCAYNHKNNTVHDTIAPSSESKKMSVSTSPIFGPAVTGATFEPIKTAADFAKIMGAGVRLSGEERSYVLMQLVLCQRNAEENDVVVSSLLAVMCPGEISLYQQCMEMPRKERGILQFALGGPCHTVVANGFTENPVDDSCIVLPKVCHAIATGKNSKLRSGSVRRLISHTKGALEQVRQNVEKASSDEEKAKMKKYEERISNMLTDAENYLSSPAGKVPPIY